MHNRKILSTNFLSEASGKVVELSKPEAQALWNLYICVFIENLGVVTHTCKINTKEVDVGQPYLLLIKNKVFSSSGLVRASQAICYYCLVWNKKQKNLQMKILWTEVARNQIVYKMSSILFRRKFAWFSIGRNNTVRANTWNYCPSLESCLSSHVTRRWCAVCYSVLFFAGVSVKLLVFSLWKCWGYSWGYSQRLPPKGSSESVSNKVVWHCS